MWTSRNSAAVIGAARRPIRTPTFRPACSVPRTTPRCRRAAARWIVSRPAAPCTGRVLFRPIRHVPRRRHRAVRLRHPGRRSRLPPRRRARRLPHPALRRKRPCLHPRPAGQTRSVAGPYHRIPPSRPTTGPEPVSQPGTSRPDRTRRPSTRALSARTRLGSRRRTPSSRRRRKRARTNRHHRDGGALRPPRSSRADGWRSQPSRSRRWVRGRW
jgi:hypothetical protein